jgi:hypothetical protein
MILFLRIFSLFLNLYVAKIIDYCAERQNYRFRTIIDYMDGEIQAMKKISPQPLLANPCH